MWNIFVMPVMLYESTDNTEDIMLFSQENTKLSKINTLGACFNSSGTLILMLFKGLLLLTVYLHTQF